MYRKGAVGISWLQDFYNSQKKGPATDIEPVLINAIFRLYDRFGRLGLTARTGQQDMSLDIADAYIHGHNAMIEAGVGIGKSFAYLIPGLLINQLSRQPVIIATSSIQLSEQIHRDLRFIGNRLGFSMVRSVVGKGMGQYACRLRAVELPRREASASPLTGLAERIIHGEINERADLKSGVSDALWSSVCVNDCRFEHCHFRSTCSFYEMRAKINAGTAEMDFIIVNQDLLIRDLIKKKEGTKGLITDRPALIVIDEAHNLEAKVRDAQTLEFTLRGTCRALEDAVQLLVRQSADRSLMSSLQLVTKCLRGVFRQVEDDLRQNAKQDNDRIKVSEITGMPLLRGIQILQEFRLSLAVLVSRHEREIDNAYEAVGGMIHLFQVLAGAEKRYLLWAGSPRGEATVSICPKGISQFLKHSLFNGKTPVILTSATLCQTGETLKEQYAYLTESLGYRGEYMERQASPFDYKHHTMMYIARNVPYYTPGNREAYLEAAYKELLRLCNVTDGRALVLFSAKEDMKYVHQKLSAEKLDWALHMQREGSSQDGIIAEFRKSKGVLLSTGVFWEGVNIEGSDLSQLIVFRLPFPVPADPVYEYKAAMAGDPMQEVFVPDMLLRLRQGTGRLIRSETDLGIVSILDSRLSAGARNHYREQVLAALPFRRVTEDFGVLEQFVREKGIHR